MESLMIGWTTVETPEEARRLAAGLVEKRLAACVHLEAPIEATFFWEGKAQCETEYRLAVKFPSANRDRIEQWLRENHPYDVPMWIAVTVDAVNESYRKWALEMAEPEQ